MDMINRNYKNQYVIFNLDDESYGIDIYNVKTIERISNFTRVPNTPEYIKGVINLRGEVTPVIDLRVKFGIQSKEIDKDSRIIITTFDEKIIGLLVDSSSEVIELESEEIDNVPSIGNKNIENYIDGIGKKNGELILLLKLKKVFDINEMI